ncbi:MAG TPA: disulfide bond formation protein B [Sphingomonadaceae bacterium]|nr:disulfide bond formation protein B [Sphingomonadaceae bacterium]
MKARPHPNPAGRQDRPPGDPDGRPAPEGGGLSRARLLALLVPAALLAGALGSQYLGGLSPCEMCHWQRWPHYAAVALALAAFAIRPAARSLVVLAALAILTSGAIGVYHAGVELGVFPGLTSCASTATGASTEELLASIMNTPVIRCDQVQFAFLGISMAGWNAVLSLTSGGLILWLLRRR